MSNSDITQGNLGSSLLGAYVQDVVSSNECITVLVFQLTIAVLFSLFQSNVHVTIKASQYSCNNK